MQHGPKPPEVAPSDMEPEQSDDELLDEALEESFPASDPVAFPNFD